MKRTLTIISAMCIIFSCNACTPKKNVNDNPVRQFELDHYLGTWYEIARIDHSFERGMEFTQAIYSLNPDGTVRVENSGIKNGKFKQSIGKAKCPDSITSPAHLRVSFFGPFYSDYRVLMVDRDYRYSLVSSKGPDYLWILSRDPQLPDDVLHEIMSEAHVRGFDTTRLKWVNQPRQIPFKY